MLSHAIGTFVKATVQANAPPDFRMISPDIYGKGFPDVMHESPSYDFFNGDLYPGLLKTFGHQMSYSRYDERVDPNVFQHPVLIHEGKAGFNGWDHLEIPLAKIG